MSVVKKVIEQKVEGYDVKTEYEFNTEDIGMRFTTTMDRALCFEHKLMKEVTESIVSLGEVGKKVLIDELGKKGYDDYIKRLKENLADYALWMSEATGKDKVKATTDISAQGKVKTFVNGRLNDSMSLPEDLAKNTLMCLRSLVIHDEMPKALV